MTKQIGEHGLFCLNPEDYAAYAQAMQCNAEAIDAALTSQNASLENFSDRPYGSFTNAFAQTVFNDGAGGTIGAEDLVGNTQIMGIGMNGSFNRISNGVGNWPTGFYLYGASVNWTVATPNNNTRRMLMLYGVDVVDGFSSAPATYTDLFVATDYEGSTGGTGALTVTGMLHNDGNLNFVESLFTHRNTSSTINIAVGQWRMWIVYLGSGVVI